MTIIMVVQGAGGALVAELFPHSKFNGASPVAAVLSVTFIFVVVESQVITVGSI